MTCNREVVKGSTQSKRLKGRSSLLSRVVPLAKPGHLTFLFEADFDGDKVLEEDIVDMGVVLVEEVFQVTRLSILCREEKEEF